VIIFVVGILPFLILVLWWRKRTIGIGINPKKWGDEEILNLLHRLCHACDEDDRATISMLNPQARKIGEELNRRGGTQEMQRIWRQLENIPGANALYYTWDGIGDWRKR
jgi:hypothetical protein